jgi:H+/Cl- antiporter ClcA
MTGRKRFRTRVRRAARMPLLSPRQWRRRLVFWFGAGIVALVALGFAQAADAAGDIFLRIIDGRPWIVLLLSPAGVALCVWLTRNVFPGAQGSGIPQTIAALHLIDREQIATILSMKVACGKIVLTLVGLMCGASIGREGPTVQIGAAIMHALGRSLRLPRIELERALVLAGGAAGVAAAFNTPIAGVVFAIEELSHSFESRASGTVLTAVILAGMTTLALAGNYTYFGTSSVQMNFGAGWLAVLLCAAVGGVAGGTFSEILVRAARGLPGWPGRFIQRNPVLFAALCGLALAVIGLLSHGSSYGTGYVQAKGVVEGNADLPYGFAPLKLLASAISYLSGIPGGIFAPSLAVGAGIGQWLSHFVASAPSGAVVLLGMVAYFSAVVQAPITAVIIVRRVPADLPQAAVRSARAALPDRDGAAAAILGGLTRSLSRGSPPPRGPAASASPPCRRCARPSARGRWGSAG